MKTILKCLILLLVIISKNVLAQTTTTLTSNGNWDNTAIWSGANIGNAITEDVSWNNNTGIVQIRNTFSYTVGNVTMNGGNTLTINHGGSLTLGASGTSKSLTSANNTTINVDGSLIIWGDVTVNNNLTMNVTGTLTIKGNITMSNNASLSVSGTMTVDGNFTAGTSTTVSVGGVIHVGGNVNVWNNSVASGSGHMVVAGTCSDGNSASFCGQGPLPIQLLFFEGVADNKNVSLKWATSSERNFEHFDIQRSKDGSRFSTIGTVQGNGTTFIRHDYFYNDELPLSGQSYYRLAAIDLDGSQEYFKVVAMKTLLKKSIRFFPNPVTDGKIKMQLDDDVIGSGYQISIYEFNGIKLVSYASDEPLVDFPIALSNGVYVLLFKSPEYEERITFSVK